MEKLLGVITANYSTKYPSVLSETRPVASLPYLGRYRVVDFALSNMVNAGILPGSAFGTSRTGSRFLLRDLEYNKVFLKRSDAELVVLSSASFVYNMDYNKLVEAHKASGADITVLVQSAKGKDADVTGLSVDGERVHGIKHGVDRGDVSFLDCFVIGRELARERPDLRVRRLCGADLQQGQLLQVQHGHARPDDLLRAVPGRPHDQDEGPRQRPREVRDRLPREQQPRLR